MFGGASTRYLQNTFDMGADYALVFVTYVYTHAIHMIKFLGLCTIRLLLLYMYHVIYMLSFLLFTLHVVFEAFNTRQSDS